VKNNIAEIEKAIEKIRKDLEETSKFRVRLYLKKSDLIHFIKVSEQNLKYLTKRNVIPIAGEYQKVVKSKNLAKKQLESLEEDLISIDSAIKKLNKKLKEMTETLENLKKNSEPKILEFKRKNSQVPST
jgi:septal ring factor EnvC (AmiA/AmiB activator)